MGRLDRFKKEANFRLEPGLVLAVEPMVNMGRPEVDTLGDHWTDCTGSGSRSTTTSPPRRERRY